MNRFFDNNIVRKMVVVSALAAAPVAASAAVFVSVGFAPPALPVYTQPVCPGAGYMWTPGYWAYGDAGYYWVPGVWVMAPSPGLLWTPGYWGWGGAAFLWHAGYWGPHVGFYGGINYGFGYTGAGFFGGRWVGGAFQYNTAVVNVNRTVIHNTYVQNVNVTNVGVHTAYNGGAGGIQARPTAEQQQFAHEQHTPPTAMQQQHVQNAQADRANYAKANGGHPTNLAESREGERAGMQQQRIGQGVRSGQLTAGETRNLENREANINRTTAQDRAADGGRLTQQQRQQINQRQNNVSGAIDRDKHNDRVQPRAEAPRGGGEPRGEGDRGGDRPR